MTPQHHSRRPSEADWFPDWMPNVSAAEPSHTGSHLPADYHLPELSNTKTHVPADHLLYPRASTTESHRLSDASHGASSSGDKMGTVEERAEEEDDGAIPTALDEDELVIERNRDRAVKYVSRINY